MAASMPAKTKNVYDPMASCEKDKIIEIGIHSSIINKQTKIWSAQKEFRKIVNTQESMN